MTVEGLKRLTHDWNRVTLEPIKIEQIRGAVYAYGSELACLRLFYYYRYSPDKARASFSVSLNTWYFSLELNEGV